MQAPNYKYMLNDYFSLSCFLISFQVGVAHGLHIVPSHSHYENVLKISPSKTENFQIKSLIFSYFYSKYRLWVPVRTASPRRF